MRTVGIIFLMTFTMCSCLTEKFIRPSGGGGQIEGQKLIWNDKIVGKYTIMDGVNRRVYRYSWLRAKKNQLYKPKLINAWDWDGTQVVKNGSGYIPSNNSGPFYLSNGQYYKHGQLHGICGINNLTTTYKNGKKNGWQTSWAVDTQADTLDNIDSRKTSESKIIFFTQFFYKKDKKKIFRNFSGSEEIHYKKYPPFINKEIIYKFYNVSYSGTMEQIKSKTIRHLKHWEFTPDRHNRSKHIEYYENGNIKKTSYFKDTGYNEYGKVGKWEYWGQDNKIDSVEIYSDDNLIKTLKYSVLKTDIK